MKRKSDWNSRHSDKSSDDATEGDPSSFFAVATVLVVCGSLAVALFVAVGVLAWKGAP